MMQILIQGGGLARSTHMRGREQGLDMLTLIQPCFPGDNVHLALSFAHAVNTWLSRGRAEPIRAPAHWASLYGTLQDVSMFD